jgi:translation initiation factor 1
MSGLFAGTSLERPVTCERCEKPLLACVCPRGADGKILLPKDQQVRVQRERRNGKMVTVVTGLDPKANDLKELAKKLKQKFSTGGTVNETGGVELQGDHRDAMVKHLTGLGYAAKASGG